MFRRRETMIALRARHQSFRIASDIDTPHLDVPLPPAPAIPLEPVVPPYTGPSQPAYTRYADALPLAPQDRRVADSAAAAGTTSDSAAGATAAAPPAPAPIALARVAGRWEMRAIPEAGADTTVTHYTLTATTDATGWSFTFRDRPPVPVRVAAVGGDSIVLLGRRDNLNQFRAEFRT